MRSKGNETFTYNQIFGKLNILKIIELKQTEFEQSQSSNFNKFKIFQNVFFWWRSIFLLILLIWIAKGRGCFKIYRGLRGRLWKKLKKSNQSLKISNGRWNIVQDNTRICARKSGILRDDGCERGRLLKISGRLVRNEL